MRQPTGLSDDFRLSQPQLYPLSVRQLTPSGITEARKSSLDCNQVASKVGLSAIQGTTSTGKNSSPGWTQ